METIMSTKQCNVCNEEKSLNEYSPDKKSPDSKGYKCKSCMNQYHKLRRREKPEYNKQWQNTISAVYEIFSGDLSLYVGKSSIMKGRLSKHKSLIKHPHLVEKNHPSRIEFYSNIRSHSNVDFRIVEECSPEALLPRERHYIDVLKPLYNTHNT